MSPASATATTKGERTRAAILDAALRIVSKAGLGGLTIGTLADATGMSKSGLFAHFGSREELLLAVLAHGQAQFTEVVSQPAPTPSRLHSKCSASRWWYTTTGACWATPRPGRAPSQPWTSCSLDRKTIRHA